MSDKEHRRGCKFSPAVKHAVMKRSGGLCEHPSGCDNPHNGQLDHITSCFIGAQLGMDRAELRSVANAQTLCAFHDAEKTLVLEPAAIEANNARLKLGRLRMMPPWLKARRVA